MKLQISLASTFHEFDISSLSKFVKIQKSYFICYGFGSLHGVLIRPITLERAFGKALKCIMVMEK